MEKIIMKRGGGKTTELIKRSAETGDYIVCRSNDTANSLLITAKDMGLEIPHPMTYFEFVNGTYNTKHIKGVLIDDLEVLLEKISKVPVNAITMTEEE